MIHRLITLPLMLLLLVLFPQGIAKAQSFVRDAELEAFIREVSDPIFEAAGLTPASVNMYFLHDPSLNAFVTGGQNIFIHTGLLGQADHLGQVIGVIAHETCHISCGHRIRTGDALANVGAISILSLVLGAAAIAAGGGTAGIGLLGAGQSVATGQFLAYSRGQESEADLAAARYLEAAGVSGRGLIEFFDKLRDLEILAQVRQNPYVRTHPLNRQRILQLQQAVEGSPYFDIPIDPRLNERFLRLKAKLAGYTDKPYATLRKYPPHDVTISARYARVYAYHKALEWDKALAEADALIALEPDNPYFYEIKGQIQLENHQVANAQETLKKAVELAPDSALIITSYGQALVSEDTEERMKEAIPILKTALRYEPGNSFAWYNLARAYGTLGDEALANLATAERYYGARIAGPAYTHAVRAAAKLETGTSDWIRAQDIIAATEEAVEKSQRRK